jgi:hypothetical protein
MFQWVVIVSFLVHGAPPPDKYLEPWPVVEVSLILWSHGSYLRIQVRMGGDFIATTHASHRTTH